MARGIASAAKRGVELNRVPLQMVQRQAHGRERRGADGDGALHALREVHRPLQRLHAADGAAHHGMQALDAEVIEQPACARTMSRMVTSGKSGP